jgi:PAS domain S-box-containing protein
MKQSQNYAFAVEEACRRCLADRSGKSDHPSRAGFERWLIASGELRRLDRQRRQLRESEEMHRIGFEDSPEAHLIVVDGIVVDCNKAAEIMLRGKRKQIIGQSPAFFCPVVQPDGQKSTDATARIFSEALQSGHRTFEWVHRRLDGSAFWVEVSVAAMTLKKRPALFVTWRDIADRKRAEETLRTSHLRLAQAIDLARVVNWEYDPAADQLTVDDRFYALYGTTASREGDTKMPSAVYIREFVHPDDAPLVAQEFGNALRTVEAEYHKQMEHRIIRRDGEVRHIIVRYTIIRDTGGQIVSFFGANQDITERKRDEEARKRLAAIVEFSFDAIIGETLDGTIESWNKAAERIHGYTAQEAVGRNSAMLVPADRADEIPAMLTRVASGEQVENFHTLRQRKDGSLINVSLSLSPILDSNGRITGISKIVRDITVRTRAVEALRESQQLIEGIINAIPVRVFWKDTNLVYLGCNAVFARDAGFADPKEIVGKDDYQMGWRDQAELYRASDRQVIQSGCPKLLMEEPQTAPDGRILTVLANKIPLRGSDGKIGGILGTYMDITERKRAEDLERERTVLKGSVAGMEKVLGVVGHELRTPLAGIRAMCEFILDDAGDQAGQARQFLQSIHDEVCRMSDTVDNLLEAARLNSGKVRWNWSEVSIAAVCNDAISTVQPLIDSTQIRLSCAVADDLRMQGDADAVRRLIMNLVNNSRKFTQSGEIHVEARADGEWIELLVRDTGQGIAPEIADRLGEAFALNAGVVGANRIDGAGLGLAICKGIVAAHGGTMKIDSVVGRGTQVTVRLRTNLDQPMPGYRHVDSSERART